MRIGIVIIFAALVVSCATSGCAVFHKAGAAVAERIDLGDGQVFDVMPVSTAASVADKAMPGAGAAINAVEAKLAADRKEKYGPFNGLPYSEDFDAVLTPAISAQLGRTVMTRADFSAFRVYQTPIVPAPVVLEMTPDQFARRVDVQGRVVQTSLVQAVRGAIGQTIPAVANVAISANQPVPVSAPTSNAVMQAAVSNKLDALFKNVSND